MHCLKTCSPLVGSPPAESCASAVLPGSAAAAMTRAKIDTLTDTLLSLTSVWRFGRQGRFHLLRYIDSYDYQILLSDFLRNDRNLTLAGRRTVERSGHKSEDGGGVPGDCKGNLTAKTLEIKVFLDLRGGFCAMVGLPRHMVRVECQAELA